MFHRWIKYLVLASLLVWGTGAAQFVHERTEHSDGDEAMVATGLLAHRDANSPHHERHPAHHNHDDCPTCQLLAHLKATPFAAPPPICVHLPTREHAPSYDYSIPLSDPIPFAPIRGPPAAA
ncbi:MAG TPA: DUF2946 family protein [Humisphaera sp.]|jgi:hypothetical protein|nr:DUF2946 family protein [Humisphaera sp.]